MRHQLNTQPEMEKSLTHQLNESREELKTLNEELSFLFNSIDEVLWSIDPVANRVLQVSKACEKIYGYTCENFLHNIDLWKEAIHPSDKRLIDRNDEKLHRGEQVTNQYRVNHKNGSILWVEVKITPVLDAEGKLVRLNGITRNITKEKTANKALLESEFLFRQFFENAHEAILVLDVHTGTISDYNRNALQLLKMSGTEMLTKTPVDLSPEFQPDGELSDLKAGNLVERTAAGENIQLEWVFRDSDGRNIPCEIRLSRVAAYGRVLIRASIIDISERKAAEERLKLQEKFHSSLIENLNDGITLIDVEGRTTYLSHSSTRISGYTLADMEGKTIFDLVHPDETEDLTTFFQSLKNKPGIPHTRQYRARHKDGHFYWLEGTIINMMHDENIKGFIANYRNIDERKSAEAEIKSFNKSLDKKVKERTAELLDANKELETFSYTVSHDLQAPLRATCGFAKILLKDYSDSLDDDGKYFLKIIDESSQRMSHLIRDLLEFSKYGKAELIRKEVNMNDLVNVVVDEMKFASGTVSYQLTKNELANADCDSNLIKQVWTNLISNAVKYSSKKSNPAIEIGCTKIKRQVVYYVKDNGAGFDMKYADKLFGVFKRMHNNEEFEGTGVGLATVQRIVNRHGGSIWAEASVNEGAVFYFTLAA